MMKEQNIKKYYQVPHTVIDGLKKIASDFVLPMNMEPV